MTRDPIFAFNPDLPDVSNFKTMTWDLIDLLVRRQTQGIRSGGELVPQLVEKLQPGLFEIATVRPSTNWIKKAWFDIVRFAHDHQGSTPQQRAPAELKRWMKTRGVRTSRSGSSMCVSGT